jgi:lactoylglutathione lyase
MPRLDHVGVYVGDLERSVNFYREVFGFPEHHRMVAGESKIAFLDIGGGLLEIIQRPGAPGEAPKGSWSHIAIQVGEYGAMESRLEGMGLELRKKVLDDGTRLAFFKDPDGHDIEIMDKGQSQ